MNWKLPNQLTLGRVVLAGGFFVLLAFYEQGAAAGSGLLTAAIVVFVVAGITDVLDGYFARRMKIFTVFGRMIDPVVDKVLVVGAFVMLTGSNFAMSAASASQGNSFEWDIPVWLTGRMASAVQAWMAVAILSREFIVSAVRGYSESRGVQFPATSAGKIKMFIQSAAICTILVQLAYLPDAEWAVCLKIAMVWLATLATALSGLAYLGKARKLLATDETDE